MPIAAETSADLTSAFRKMSENRRVPDEIHAGRRNHFAARAFCGLASVHRPRGGALQGVAHVPVRQPNSIDLAGETERVRFVPDRSIMLTQSTHARATPWLAVARGLLL
jgi:hypothetical protein